MKKEVPFLQYFSTVEDYRIKGMITYPLEEILFMVLCGLLCNFEDIDEILMWSEHNLKWLRKFLSYKKLPTAKTVRKVLSHLEPKSFQEAFGNWVSSISKNLNGVVAIDGKVIRGSKKKQTGEGSICIVRAFAHNMGLILNQKKVNEKSNEISAIPELLASLTLEGTIVTIDAIGTQKEICKKIIEKKGDYLLALKQNQASLYEDVKLIFEDDSKEIIWEEFEDTDCGHGRVEVRSIKVLSDINWLKERHIEWEGLSSIIMVESMRYNKKTRHETKEKRYYISSLRARAKDLLKYTRSHWSIENNVHWTLDVIFREDSSRTRKDYLAENMSLIRSVALNMLKKSSTDLPVKRRRVQALIDPDFRLSLLSC